MRSQRVCRKTSITEGESDADGLQVPFTADFREDRREFERRYITRCLEYTQGNVTRAAEILDMHRQSLQHKLRQLGLGRPLCLSDRRPAR
jgi:DNA-binding NtrC family response regulator